MFCYGIIAICTSSELMSSSYIIVKVNGTEFVIPAYAKS